MTLGNTPYAQRRELARRMSSGIVVTLWWDEQGTDVAVSVDVRDGAPFQIVVGGHQALHAFYHPYAFAARYGMTATRAAA